MSGRFRRGRHHLNGGQGQCIPVGEIAERISGEFIPTGRSAGSWRIVRQGYNGPEYYELVGTISVAPPPEPPVGTFIDEFEHGTRHGVQVPLLPVRRMPRVASEICPYRAPRVPTQGASSMTDLFDKLDNLYAEIAALSPKSAATIAEARKRLEVSKVINALRENAVRVDELLAENADLRRQLAELREQQEWGQS